MALRCRRRRGVGLHARSVGVAPQQCGATGQTENCQVVPMLSYASGRRHAFIDRALYLPRRWTDDPQRCAQAGVPAEGGLATKPSSWIDMLDRALGARVPFRYFTADAGYGRDPALRAVPHRRGGLRDGRLNLPLVEPGGGATRPDRVLATVPKAVWERRSCGNGTKGARCYDWAAVLRTCPPPGWLPGGGRPGDGFPCSPHDHSSRPTSRLARPLHRTPPRPPPTPRRTTQPIHRPGSPGDLARLSLNAVGHDTGRPFVTGPV
jgi:DDE superfamily endonuclease